ncbi:hypothetical protein FRACYDRAFT_269118 [Fragilariopsis cylindrus CCMP1102]|uniref:Uncharacterized protein n=1 Tax=Fragilariopsis cylindrus CCMP1102 TaxID=635003 RepID=A0A1E7FF90_9STRA|nr:hypothetical protein FRACYDRAFT_269118 [Fragilariopsis cylindrus CCMP1102]|eukprot:OEU16830.1 hypothetical protein FRACYDRAFT_269118 [Fragilariopsis cylindrus CCMP1102]
MRKNNLIDVFYLALLAVLATEVTSLLFTSICWTSTDQSDDDNEQEYRNRHHSGTRADFLKKSSSLVISAATVMLIPTDPANARGRATLEQAYERYSPRILDGGSFYKGKLKTMIAKDDWTGIRDALVEPPKKSKKDRSKIDGGISERAALAGSFSDSRVLVALDLLASQFSDNSISPKTRDMKKEVDQLRAVALGEENAGGGFFGMGAKKPTKSELSKRMKELYIIGGTSWNKYVYLANEGLPVQVLKLPYL